MMNYISKNNYKIISVLMSFLMVLSVISFTKIEANASGTVDDFVERCYTVTLGRGSDPEGFADWKSQLTSGEAVGVHVAYGFLFSSEYTKKNKSNEDYVKDLYMLFMGREPDEAGFNDWVGQLEAGKSRTEVFAGFANSQEFFNICESYGITAGRYVIGYDRFQINNVNLFVERLYKVCFGRIGDIGGQKNWVEKLIKKQITGSECARSFIQSQEYENLGLSDADYVENLYIALMGRGSDAEGKENWLNALASGKTRDEVFAGFVNSIEFSGICNTYKIDRGSYKAKDIGKIEEPASPKEYRLIKDAWYYTDGTCYLWDKYEYDTEGKLTNLTFYTPDGISNFYKIEYDTKGNKIKDNIYKSDGSISYWKEYEYDTNGNLITDTNYNSDGSVGSWNEYKYDASGKLIIQICHDNLFIDGAEYIYDENGYLIKRINYYGGFRNNWFENEYNEKGYLIKYVAYNPDGSIDYWEQNEYDANGNLIKVTDYDSDGIINWICESTYEEVTQ